MLTTSQLRTVWSPRCKGPWLTIRLNGQGSVTVRPAIGDAVLALDQVLRKWTYRTRQADTGAYVCRASAGGGGWSLHAYGIAIDINWLSNPYGRRLKTDMPAGMVRDICAIRTRSGAQVWNWGGFWSGNKDAMHYEIVCAPAAIASGINPATVAAPLFTTTPQPQPQAKPRPEPKGDPDMVRFLTSHKDYGSRLVVISDDQGYREAGVPTASDANAFAEAVPSISLTPKALQDLRRVHGASAENGRIV